MQETRLVADLNAAQREAVTTDAQPLCILAGAGSGKTRVLTRRIAHRILQGSADAPHVLALTFTRKAAGELQARLRGLGVRDGVVAGTFHAVAYAQLRRRWADRGERPPALLESKLRILAPLLGRPTAGSVATFHADVASEIEWAKARMIPASQYEVEALRAGRTPPLAPSSMAAVFGQYEAEKRRRGVVDFDDLLSMCALALDSDDEFAAGQRWRFRHLFVDEFQDVNPVQFRLLKGWLGDRTDLCVVGDPNQAIYSWNGADPRLLLGFERLFPTATVVRLENNYRSTPQVLTVANAVLAADEGPVAPGLVAHAADGPLPTLRSYATDIAEAHGVAVAIRRQHGPARPWRDFAVLVRTNAQATEFQRAFVAAQIPFRVRGGGGLLRERAVREALGSLEASPAKGVPFGSRIAELEELASAATDEAREHLWALVALAREYATLLDASSAGPSSSVSGFMAWLSATVRGDDQPDRGAGGDAVEIVTFHRAKGLEWPVVFVTGLEKGLVPVGHAEGSPDAEAEERRLLYVALTRAQVELHCTLAARRRFSDKPVRRTPSPWLGTIEAALRALATEGPSGDWRQYLESSRARLRAVDGRGGASSSKVLGAGADPEVLTALKAWRASAAKAANVPPHVIFHDTTLAAVAELRPSSRDALLSVPGLGPVKLARYGDDLLALVAEHGRSA